MHRRIAQIILGELIYVRDPWRRTLSSCPQHRQAAAHDAEICAESPALGVQSVHF